MLHALYKEQLVIINLPLTFIAHNVLILYWIAILIFIECKAMTTYEKIMQVIFVGLSLLLLIATCFLVSSKE